MPNPSPAFIDRDASELYYLAFDLLLARAPIRGDMAYGDEGSLARSSPDDLQTAARYAAIRAALLDAWLSDQPAWADTCRAAREEAIQAAAAAGLEEPVALDERCIRTLSIASQTPLPPTP